MVPASLDTMDAPFDAARMRTVIVAGLALVVGGVMAMRADVDEQDTYVLLGALTAGVVAATGLGPRASLIGGKGLPRVSLVLVAASPVAAMLVGIAVSGAVMMISLAFREVNPLVWLTILWGAVGLFGVLMLFCVVVAGRDLGRSGRIPSPWGWLALPSLALGVVGSSIKAGIAAVTVMAWMTPFTELYVTITALQSAGSTVFGAVMIVMGLLLGLVFARRRAVAAE